MSLFTFMLLIGLLVTLPWWLTVYLNKRYTPNVLINAIFTLPNYTTFVGMIAVVGYALVSLADQNQTSARDAVWLLGITITSDVLDGFYARSTGQCSKLGALLDPIRDRMLAGAILLIMTITEMEADNFKILLSIVGILMSEGLIIALYMEHRDKAKVHVFGKIRMGTHCLCGIVFTLQNGYIITEVAPTVILAHIMSLASIVALAAYYRQAHGTLPTARTL